MEIMLVPCIYVMYVRVSLELLHVVHNERQEQYVGHCPLSEVYLIYPTFRELAVLLSTGDWVVLHCHPGALVVSVLA
jgi:hypothetical protein